MSTTFSCLVTGGSIYILQLEGPSHIHLYAIYMRQGYTVVLENKLRKYGLEFKEVKSTTRISTRYSRLRHSIVLNLARLIGPHSKQMERTQLLILLFSKPL